MRKIKSDVGVYGPAHAPAERNHLQNIFRYQRGSVSNAATQENKLHSSENTVGRGCSYVQTRKK